MPARAGRSSLHPPSRAGAATDSQALQEAHTALRKARTALGWAIGATVGAVLAIVLAVVGLLIAGASAAEDAFAFEPLRGEVVGLPDGSPLGGERLEHQLVDLLREYGEEDIEISCPDTAPSRCRPPWSAPATSRATPGPASCSSRTPRAPSSSWRCECRRPSAAPDPTSWMPWGG